MWWFGVDLGRTDIQLLGGFRVDFGWIWGWLGADLCWVYCWKNGAFRVVFGVWLREVWSA